MTSCNSTGPRNAANLLNRPRATAILKDNCRNERFRHFEKCDSYAKEGRYRGLPTVHCKSSALFPFDGLHEKIKCLAARAISIVTQPVIF